MQTLSQPELSALSANASVLELDGLGPKVLKLTDGSFLKLFRKRSVFSRETLKPYAKRFAENAIRLQHMGFNSPQIIQVYWLVDPINRTAVHYSAFCKVVVASAVFLCSHFQCRLLPLGVQCDGPDGLPIPRRA
ncbi:hypothetical protein [Pseudomonas sp.]|uniref:hypothetical protein n=1 Tax=Pseudomonas sp. TaxID=306 RepID=UPI004053AB1A